MPPAGPVYLTVPLDDWNATIDTEPTIRTVSTAYAPDPSRLADFAARILKAKKLALVYGEEVDQSLGWDAGIALAELLNAPVFEAPLQARAGFPANNPLYQGSLGIGQGTLGEELKGYDLVLVIGAEVFRYYPWAPGPVLQHGTELLQTTNSPHDAGAARVGDSLLSDARLALQGLHQLLSNATRPSSQSVETGADRTALTAAQRPPSLVAESGNTSSAMSAAAAFKAIAMGRRSSDLLVQESPSNVEALLRVWPIVQQESYYTSASDFLGWGLPASVGISLAQINRTTIAVIGDGSLQYSIQSIYSAVQHRAKVIFLVPQNDEYAILKEFAVYQDTPGCPGMNIPGISPMKIAEGYGCPALFASTPQELLETFEAARQADGPALILFPINPALQALPV